MPLYFRSTIVWSFGGVASWFTHPNWMKSDSTCTHTERKILAVWCGKLDTECTLRRFPLHAAKLWHRWAGSLGLPNFKYPLRVNIICNKCTLFRVNSLSKEHGGRKAERHEVKGTDGPDDSRKMATPQSQRSRFGRLRGFRNWREGTDHSFKFKV